MAEPDLKPLFDLIGRHEVGGAAKAQGVESDYDVVVSLAFSVLPPPAPLTSMTVREVMSWQGTAVAAYRRARGSAVGYSAAGRYQIIRRTLSDLRSAGTIDGSDSFDAATQDRCCRALLQRRGLNDWLAREISDESFANNLAREWASLPVVTPQRGQSRLVEPGQSFYAGDGVNKASAPVEAVMAALIETRAAVRSGRSPGVAGLGRPIVPSPVSPESLRLAELEARVARLEAALRAAHEALGA